MNLGRIQMIAGLAADLVEVAVVPLLRGVQRDEPPRVEEIFASVGEAFRSTIEREKTAAAIDERFPEEVTR